MLQPALALIIASAVVALIALIPALGFGGKILPGYCFKAKGKPARMQELYLLRTVALLIYTVAILLSAYGVVVYFYDAKLMLILSVITALVAVFWVVLFLFGKPRKAARAAKELSEGN